MHHDHHNPKPNHPGNGNGFMAGLMVGAVLATILSTKKGRAMVKDMASMALEHLDNFLEEEAVGTLQEEPFEPPVAPTREEPLSTLETEEVTDANRAQVVESIPEEPKKPKRKFFRGIKNT